MIRFRRIHMAATEPVPDGDNAVLLRVTQISYLGDRVSHYYGFSVDIPEGFIGILIPSDSVIEVAEKVGAFKIIRSCDKSVPLTFVFNLPEDLVRDNFKVGDISARLLFIPAPKITHSTVNTY